jgi:hypothetical protein
MSAVAISGNLQRRWTAALLPVALRDKYAPSTIAVAMALIELHYNRSTGQLDPGNALIAAELGIAKRTVIRALDELQAGGWIRRHKGARHETTGITMHIPEVTTGVTSNATDAASVEATPRNGFRGDTKPGLEVTRNGFRGDNWWTAPHV